MSREPGRHRPGTPCAAVRPRRWDPAKQAAAGHLDMLEPGWAIFYGVGSRHFHAIALWQAREALQVRATTVEGLRELMREAETDAMWRSAASWRSKRPTIQPTEEPRAY